MIAIVGNGLAAISLAKSFLENKIDFHLYDDCNKNNASSISSGIVNPVSGRNFVVNPYYDVFLEAALNFYRIEDQPYIEPIKVYRKLAHDFQAAHLSENTFDNQRFIRFKTKDIIEILGCYQIRVNPFIEAIKQTINQRVITLKIEDFWQSIQISPHTTIQIGDYRYDKVIFAEGIAVLNNPYFKDLLYNANRGEILLLEDKGQNLDHVYHHGKFICPYEAKIWLGSSFDKVSATTKVKTKENYDLLVQHIDQLFLNNSPPKEHIIGHFGAFRTTTWDRMPIIGSHLSDKRLWVFNGFGAKGTSMIPYFTSQLTQALISDKPIDSYASIERCYIKLGKITKPPKFKKRN
ncbi:MAG: FAD-dependent oxidoreductase [Chitinophagales bacterium]|jgi:hypothetical protein|nr:FAD-dependent oxidoreductase [Chitinophagales bacterium]